MKHERYKQLMIDVGMANSQSLLNALRQAVYETEQETEAVISELKESNRLALATINTETDVLEKAQSELNKKDAVIADKDKFIQEMVEKAASKHRPAYEEQQRKIMKQGAVIAECRVMLADINYLLEATDHIDCNSPVHRKIKALLNKVNG